MSYKLLSSYFTTSLAGHPAGRVGEQELEETKLRLTQPSLVKLGLGLRLAYIKDKRTYILVLYPFLSNLRSLHDLEFITKLWLLKKRYKYKTN